MKNLLKVVLPTAFFLAFGISVMLIVSSCERDPGSKCSDCSSNADCDSGLNCYSFTNGSQKCAEHSGDLCIGI
jgi:hypothetical protein